MKIDYNGGMEPKKPALAVKVAIIVNGVVVSTVDPSQWEDEVEVDDAGHLKAALLASVTTEVDDVFADFTL